MKTIEVRSTLQYRVDAPTTFDLQIAVADNAHQRLLEESVETEPVLEIEHARVGPAGNRPMRIVAAPGPLVVRYRGLVELSQDFRDPETLDERPAADLSADVRSFLDPSLYCESDRLRDFADRTFGSVPAGHARVKAVADWVHDALEYVPGSTDSSTSARDVLEGRRGVCRDYAHLTIALCRALGIPARYVSGYAVDLEPQDFHGFCEVWLDEWYLFDATRLAPLSGLVRIATGRDAADASFATLVGSASAQSPPSVSAVRVPEDGAGRPGEVREGARTSADAAISTA